MNVSISPNFKFANTLEYHKFFVLINLCFKIFARQFCIDMGKFKTLVESENFDPEDNDKTASSDFLFHMADISNPSKPWLIWQKWTDLLFIEFFDQGDKERELGIDISFLMDRTTTNIAKAQDGFIKNLIRPAYSLLSKMLPHLRLNLRYMDVNIEHWSNLVVQYSAVSPEHPESNKSPTLKNKEQEDEKTSNSSDSFVKDEIIDEVDQVLRDQNDELNDRMIDEELAKHNDNHSQNLNTLLESNSLNREVSVSIYKTII